MHQVVDDLDLDTVLDQEIQPRVSMLLQGFGRNDAVAICLECVFHIQC